MKIKTCSDYEELSRAAAELFAERAQQAVSQRGRFSVALSGGNTPQRAYEMLAEAPLRDQIPWEKVHVFWGDERMVPADDGRNNARMARRAFLDKVPIPAANIRTINTALNPMLSAELYEQALRRFFGRHGPFLDLAFMGLGTDGHTASLFPGTPALEEIVHWVADVFVPNQRVHRVTLTPRFLNESRTVAFLVSGSKKAWVLRSVLEGKEDYRSLPAQIIRPVQGELIWLVDEAAASMLAEIKAA